MAKIQIVKPAPLDSPLPARIKAFRKSRQWGQAELAKVCGVNQSQVSRWEAGDDTPSAAAIAAMTKLVDDSDRAVWLADLGLHEASTNTAEGLRVVPILWDAAAAGTPRAVDEALIERHLALPSAWLPRGGKIYGVRVSGESMSPIVHDGWVVFIDITRRVASELIGRMVAARNGDGITIKWLEHDGDVYVLVPQNLQEHNAIRLVRASDDWSIVGEVVRWIGEPLTARKRR